MAIEWRQTSLHDWLAAWQGCRLYVSTAFGGEYYWRVYRKATRGPGVQYPALAESRRPAPSLREAQRRAEAAARRRAKQ